MIAPGTKLGRYEIRAKLGEGGMGEVYLAQDTKLDRKAALKILPAEVASHRDRMNRFVREAKAAAALNHPNIAHVYEIDEADGQHFIAMEFIDGVTLREKIQRKHKELRKLLRYLQQVAEALAKAHAAGIVHRDLKPDNIMITRDDYAKILDFGLAKLIEARGSLDRDTVSSEVSTALIPQQSLPGTLLGTVGYMSPEQAQGRVNEIDHRSDIFSFGCILYETATEQRAFEGKDALDSLHKIVHAPTPQIGDVNPEAPDELQRIVRRCLAKDPDKRYQSIKEVAIELEELQDELKSASEPRDSAHQTASSPYALGERRTVLQSGASSDSARVLPTSSAEILIAEIKRHKTGVGVALAVALIVIAAAGYGIYKLVSSRPANVGPAQMKISRLTTGGRVGNAAINGETAISPDGKYVVFVTAEAGKQALWVRQVSTGSLVQIVPPVEATYTGNTFSPDGELVYFTRYNENTASALYQVSVLGGTPRKILTDINGSISFSPDGKRFAFVRFDLQRGESALMLANADGSGEQKLESRKQQPPFSPGGPSWSPDGKIIACGVVDNSGSRTAELVAVPANGGPEKILTSQKFAAVLRVLWLADGSGLVMTAVPEASSTNTQVWFVSYPAGDVRRITNDLNSYGVLSLGLTADGKTIVAVQDDKSAQIFVLAANEDASRAGRVSNGKYDGTEGLAWTPDGKIVYVTETGNSVDIWIMNADGTNQRQLTSDSYFKLFPSVSPDGHYIFFSSNRSGSMSIWRMEIDGSNPKQLTEGQATDYFPVCSPDGVWVIFGSVRSGKFTLWKMPMAGGEPVQLTDRLAFLPAISPDGKWIAFFTIDEASKKLQLGIMLFEGRQVTKSFNVSPTFSPDINPTLLWTTDGAGLTYVDQFNGADNILSQSISGGAPKPLTNFTSDKIFNFAWSRDGKRLAVSHGTVTTDVVLIKDFR